MIIPESYLMFVGASIILAIVPGPDMIYLLSRCIAQGKEAGLMAAFGINLGGYVHLAAATLGLSAILATSTLAFAFVKWLGVAYLVYLGVRTLLAKSPAIALESAGANNKSGRAIFYQGLVSDVLNPKVAIFFLALLPQFVQEQSGHPALQMLILGVTNNIIDLSVSAVLIFLAAKVTAALRRNTHIAAWLGKGTGVVFISLGAMLVGETA